MRKVGDDRHPIVESQRKSVDERPRPEDMNQRNGRPTEWRRAA
jgi:hypothetical protein